MFVLEFLDLVMKQLGENSYVFYEVELDNVVLKEKIEFMVIIIVSQEEDFQEF